ncbi:MAG: hypothetical protein ACYC4H_11230 [Desulfocucumaceae bacterium]
MSDQMTYDLNLEMIDILAKEFDVRPVADSFAEGLEAGIDPGELAKDVYGSYGREWAIRTLELGERYSDRTYENLKEVAKRIQRLVFPHIPQRFLEIGYLATQPFEILTIKQNNHEALIFEVPECAAYAALVEKCGEKTAADMPCRYGCMAFNQTIYKRFNLDVSLEMTASMPVDGFCRFAALNPSRG